MIIPLRERTLGNSPTQLIKIIQEQHSKAYIDQCTKYLTAVAAITKLRPNLEFPPPPEPEPIPTAKWLLGVYARDVEEILPELKGEITSTFGNILKMDSTFKVKHE